MPDERIIPASFSGGRAYGFFGRKSLKDVEAALKDVEARGHFVFVALADGYLVPK
jgi:hypothetical protein